MWYFAWCLGILLACSLAVINGLWLEEVEANELAKNKLTAEADDKDENNGTA